MKANERVAYLRGLLKGMEIDSDPKTERLWTALLDTLDVFAVEINKLQEQNREFAEEIGELYDELDDLNDDLWADIDKVFLDSPYEVVCPTCGQATALNAEQLSKGCMVCPSCGEELEFDLSDLSEEDLPAFNLVENSETE